jgi:predicted nucleic acid-binding protein
MEPDQDGFVVDSSVTMAWCFDDEATDYTDKVRDALVEVRAVVPALWRLEVANASLVGERRRRLDAARVRRFLTLLAKLPIVIDEETAERAWGETLHLAWSQNLSVYDAAYLELAIRRGLPLATLDEKLKAAAKAAGAAMYAAS